MVRTGWTVQVRVLASTEANVPLGTARARVSPDGRGTGARDEHALMGYGDRAVTDCANVTLILLICE